MDFNAMYYTSGLKDYVTAFQADNVSMYTTTWSYNSTTWTSVFVHVPNSQLVIELCQDTVLEGLGSDHHPTPRASPRALEMALAMVHPVQDQVQSSALIWPLAVNRAVSAATMAKLEDF